MLWTWLSIMNPHRYTYGFAYSAPLAAMSAAALMLGLLMAKDRESPFKGVAVNFFMLLILWMTLSWLFGLDVQGDYEQWKKVMKVDFMILASLMVLRSKQHIFALMWVCVLSIGLLSAKGGLFTLATGGGYRVWGPPGSFIEGNNEFALASIMIVPLMRFLQLQVDNRWIRHGLTAGMLLCTVSALGSHSRGAFLAIGAMAFLLWWRGKNKLGVGVIMVLAAIPMLSFLPQEWWDRMATIESYDEDRSAMGRISAWWVAWRIGLNHLFGVGFNPATPSLFAMYSPYPDYIHAAHSIYFQILGNHGFIGLFCFMGIWAATWFSAGWLYKQKNLSPEMKWTADLGAMCQVALAGYAVGGAFLSLAYFDLAYNIMVMVVLTRVWVMKELWKTEPVYAKSWRTIPGLVLTKKPA